MKYKFNLAWGELPEELREAKIREYILGMDKCDCEECDGTGVISITTELTSTEVKKPCTYCKGTGLVNPDPDDLHWQEEAEQDIRFYFPICF